MKQAVATVESPSTAVESMPSNMIDKAIAQGAGVEVIEKLMGLQERWDANQARKLFNEAVAAAKAEIPSIDRNREGHNKKRYMDFSAIAKIVDPVLSKNGLSYRFTTEQGDKINVTCVLFHSAGHSEKTTLSGPADTTGNKNAIQAIGSTLTYLQRYSLVQMLGLAASDDDDGNAGVAGPKITEDQAITLIDMLEAKGANRAKFLIWAKVERVEDIPADYYDSCVTAINNIPAKK